MTAFTSKYPRTGVQSIFGTKGDITELPYAQLDLDLPLPSYSPGRLAWDPDNHTITLDLENNVRQQIGQELPIPCMNMTGSTIANGQVVYIEGFELGHLTISLAKADAVSTSVGTFGITTQEILDGAVGYVTTVGFVRDLNTSSFTAGIPLYLSATVAGGVTSVRPSYPNVAIQIGFCGASDILAGSIWVTSQVFPDAQQIFLPTSGTPVDNNNILDWFRHTATTGLIDGGDLTDSGATVSIAASDFYVREGLSEDDDLRVYRIPASGAISVAANDVTYIYLNYNSGTPIWGTGTSLSDFNGIDKVIVYVIGRNSSIGQNNVIDLRKINVDSNRKSRRQKAEFDGYVFKGFWRSSLASSTLTASGLNIAVAAGRYFFFDNPISHSAFDTAVAGTALANVFSYFYSRTGTWTQITNSKTINTTQYDVGGVLTALTNNRFRADWVYVVLDGASPYLAVVLGDNEYASLALAQEAPLPTSLPPQFDGIGVLIGQVVIQKSAASVTTRQAGSGTFSGGSVTTLPASAIINTPAGNIAATTVQAAIDELDTEKAKVAGDSTQAFAAAALTVAGNVTLGDASTDTVTVNGYMGVGVAPNAAIGLFLNSSALTGTSQYGVYSQPVATSAATASVYGALLQPRTAASAFTTAQTVAAYIPNAVLGAGSAITNQYGVLIDDQTRGTNNYGITSLVSSGTNKWNIYASGTASNYFAGLVGVGVSPTARNNTTLQIKDGIGFPATQVASSDANTLDDYEEGTFTPVLRDAAAGNASAATVAGRYTKVGRVVHFVLSCVNINTTGLTAGNTIYITGLPFTSISTANHVQYFPVLRTQMTSTDGSVGAQLGPNTAYLILSNDLVVVAGSSGALVSQINSTSGDIYISGAYEAA